MKRPPRAKAPGLTNIRPAAMTPLLTRMTASTKRSLSLNSAKIASSNMKGAHRAAAKGQPRIPPMANQNIP